jgi:hypothetical protein
MSADAARTGTEQGQGVMNEANARPRKLIRGRTVREADVLLHREHERASVGPFQWQQRPS